MPTDLRVWRQRAADHFAHGTSQAGSFVDGLFDLCAHADADNLNRLRKAFPAAVSAWRLERDFRERNAA